MNFIFRIQLILCLILFGVCIGRYVYFEKYFLQHSVLDDYVDAKFIKLDVVEEVDVKNGWVTLKGKLSKICHDQTYEECEDVLSKGFVRVRIFEKTMNALLEKSEISEFGVGDQIGVKGEVRRVKNCNELSCTKEDISFANFLKKEMIMYEIISPKILKIDPKTTHTFTRFLIDFRKVLERKIAENLESPWSDLAQGLVISGKGSMSEELLEQFRKVGLIHIVVLSGSNVSIISAALFAVMKRTPKFLKSAIGISLMICFALMTGASPPVVRSVLMTAVPIVFAMLSKEKTPNKKSEVKMFKSVIFFAEAHASIVVLLITGLLICIYNPYLALYDMSFQLSFMATLGLMSLTEPISHLLHFLPEKFGIREIVSSSLATQVFVLPLLLQISKDMSLVFIIANILVLPILPLTMFFIFMLLLASYIIMPITMLFSGVSWILLSWIIFVAQHFSSYTYSTIPLFSLSSHDSLIIYLFLLPTLFILKFMISTKKLYKK